MSLWKNRHHSTISLPLKAPEGCAAISASSMYHRHSACGKIVSVSEAILQCIIGICVSILPYAITMRLPQPSVSQWQKKEDYCEHSKAISLNCFVAMIFINSLMLMPSLLPPDKQNRLLKKLCQMQRHDPLKIKKRSNIAFL